MATEKDNTDAGLVITIGLGTGFIVAAVVIVLQIVFMLLDRKIEDEKGAWRSNATLVGPNVDYDALKTEEKKRLTRYGKWQATNPLTGKPEGDLNLHIPVEEAMGIVAKDLAKTAAGKAKP